MKRKLCFVTGSRAEYGLLKPLMEEITGDSALKLQIIATGMHLSKDFGLTYKEIEKGGFKIHKKVNMRLNSDTPSGILSSMALGMTGCAKAYEELKPDIVVLLGDRFEIFSAAQAAYVNRIPIGHIHGGELTEGVFDDAFRHSITKMSHLHFTATEEYRKRVIQLGEDPRRIYNVGALGIDSIKKTKFLTRKNLEKTMNFKFGERNLLITFHPVTLEKNTAGRQFQNLLDALKDLTDTHVIFTKANADNGGRIINRMIDAYVSRNRRKAAAFASLGQTRYLSALRFVDACVGNSSSGIIEAPSFKVPTVNIGDRQRGRLRAQSVIDCRPERVAIRQAIEKAYSESFKRSIKHVINPYGGGDAALKIKNVLKKHDTGDILKKSFFDIKFNAV